MLTASDTAFKHTECGNYDVHIDAEKLIEGQRFRKYKEEFIYNSELKETFKHYVKAHGYTDCPLACEIEHTFDDGYKLVFDYAYFLAKLYTPDGDVVDTLVPFSVVVDREMRLADRRRLSDQRWYHFTVFID